MPIYAYKCESCGHAKDVLRKVSDPPLTECPACGAQSFVKQLTAAGFQLKGSGWYATDFKGGSAAKSDSSTDAKPADTTAESKSSGSGETKTPAKSDSAPAAAGGCGASCACH